MNVALFMHRLFLPVWKRRVFEYSTAESKTPHFALQDMDTTSHLAALIRQRKKDLEEGVFGEKQLHRMKVCMSHILSWC